MNTFVLITAVLLLAGIVVTIIFANRAPLVKTITLIIGYYCSLNVTIQMVIFYYRVVQNINILLSDPKINYNPIDYQGFTPLIKACASQAYDVVKTFLRSNEININFQDKIGNTALHYAIGKQFYSIADILTMHGAKEDLLNLRGFSPWDCIENNVE